MYIHLIEAKKCCQKSPISPPRAPDVDAILENVKIFYNNVTIDQKTEEQDFISKIVQKMAKMQSIRYFILISLILIIFSTVLAQTENTVVTSGTEVLDQKM